MQTTRIAMVSLVLTACSGPGYKETLPARAVSPDAPEPVERRGDQQPDPVYSKLGTVQLPSACDPAAKPHLERGLALLHHMTYEEARNSFNAAQDADPQCAFALWGQAMTYIHPLWPDEPTPEQLEQGRALVKAAQKMADQSRRERAYLAPLEAYYQDGKSRSEKQRLGDFYLAWKRVAERHPDDVEAAAFHALALLATADPDDKSYRIQKRSGEMAQKIVERIPDHPGGHHYVIHAYDVPELASRALSVARSYGDIAPEVPHALHMASHIFTRLGLWDESIDWNQRSAAAAKDMKVDGATSLHYLHALDYLAYAYLQRAQDRRAREVLGKLRAIEGPVQPHAASAYSLAAVPARYALERDAWSEAAALEPRTPAHYDWNQAPAFEALGHFARALGAARSGDTTTAEASLERLAELHRQVKNEDPYWATQIQIQKLAAQAWLDRARGRDRAALATARRAAELEGTTEKSPITPGEILPATELYGDMLVETGRYRDALELYQRALERSPERFRSLYGAGLAAEKMGDVQRAQDHYRALVELVVDPEGDRPALQHARRYLREHGPASDVARGP